MKKGTNDFNTVMEKLLRNHKPAKGVMTKIFIRDDFITPCTNNISDNKFRMKIKNRKLNIVMISNIKKSDTTVKNTHIEIKKIITK